MRFGRRSQTDVAILYIEGLVRDGLVDEIKQRINSVDIDGTTSSSQLEQLIEKYKWTVVPQIMSTERPDRAAANILEGRAALIVDGTPFTLIIPTTFALYLTTPDDYYDRGIIVSFSRLLRYIAYFTSTSLPAIYLSLTAYHPGMLPTALALSITGARVGLPFPTFIEVFFMEFSLDVLQEAAIRLPKPMGQTISIVGGIVIGQAVIQAGIVSPVIVIIMALTGISSFIIPVYTFALSTRIIRIGFIFASLFLGMYGFMMLWLFLLIHMASLNDFGVYYLEDYSPPSFQNLKDTLFSFPQSYFTKRPLTMDVKDKTRLNPGKKGDKNEG
jgi:hypothetical protein